MNKTLLALIGALLMGVGLQAQTNTYKFAVSLKDKAGTPFTIDNPQAFLSQRAIDRRAKYGIAITEVDLPINPAYIQQVLTAASPAKLHVQAKWLNTIVIALNDSSKIAAVRALPIVQGARVVYNANLATLQHNKMNEVYRPIESVQPAVASRTVYDTNFYGGAWVQTHQLKCEELHKKGHLGAGMVVAVLDAGFYNVDNYSAFAKLRDNNQILGTYNFVKPGSSVYGPASGHGSSVLSCMGGYLEGQLVGTAPEASYWLIMTEDADSEFIVEEYNWVAGAAYADSVGADVINSSLGYVEFEDTQYNYAYHDLDGVSPIATQAANIAVEKGMMVVNSAGNDGDNSWKHIGVPADAKNIITVGAVDGDGVITSFSSRGFSWSSEVKPNVVARGGNTYVASSWMDMVSQSDGTSFSSPVMAGAVAALWSSSPDISPMDIKSAIEQSADRYSTPDTVYGYGMPDMSAALEMLGIETYKAANNGLRIFPNPASSQIMLGFGESMRLDANTQFELVIYNAQGAELVRMHSQAHRPIDIQSLPKGMYMLSITQGEQRYTSKFIKQ